MTRWKSARDSLFGDLVKDPPPAEPSVVGPPPSRTGRTLGGDQNDEPLKEKPQVVLAAPPPAAKAAPASKPREDGRTSDSGTPLVRALSVAKIGHQHEAGRDLKGTRAEEAAALAPPTGLPKLEAPMQNKKRTAQHAGAPPPPASVAAPPPAAGRSAGAIPGKKARPDTGPVGAPAGARTRKKTPPVRPESAPVDTSARSKRLRRGPKPLLLAALALLVLAAGGVSAVVLEIVPDPFAEPAPPMVRSGARPAPIAAPAPAAPAVAAAAPVEASADAKPAAAKPAAAKPATAAAPAAKPAAPAQPVAAQPKPAAPAVASVELDEATASAGIDQLVALASKALREENAPQAEALARRALAKDADDHHAMEVLARALIDQDRGAEAVQLARRIVEKRKKRVPYRLLLGDALLMAGDETGARKEWQVAAALEPGNREVAQRLK